MLKQACVPNILLAGISDSVLKKPCQPKETNPISQTDILTTSPKQEVCMDADSVQNESSMDYCATYPINAVSTFSLYFNHTM